MMGIGVTAGQVAMAAAGLVYLTDDQERWDTFVRNMVAGAALGPAPAAMTRKNAREAAIVLLGLSIALVSSEGGAAE